MKKILFFAATLTLMVGVWVNSANAFDKLKTIKVKTSAQCEGCENRIEGALNGQTGIHVADLNLSNKVVKVKYDPAQTSPETIRTLINKVGYDADQSPADEAAYNALPKCCQKGGHDHEEEEHHKDHKGHKH